LRKKIIVDKSILIFSNSPAAGTGYGQQTNYLSATLAALGYRIGIVCSYGLEAHTVRMPNGITLYPGGNNKIRDDIVQWVIPDFQPAVILSLLDVWALQFPEDPSIDIPWVAWVPVDSEPLPDRIEEKLMLTDGIVAFSKFGQRTIEATGLEADYIPHGISTDVFAPRDKNECREALGLPQDKFIIGMVAHNALQPSRKCIAETLIAFAEFHRRVPNSALYLHMMANEERQGVDIASLQDELDISEHVWWADQSGIRLGMDVNHMSLTFNSFDVLVNPSLGEGFGIPIMEAQSCGVPVIANNCTSMTELVSKAGGWLVKGQPYRNVLKSWWKQPYIESITEAMHAAYKAYTGPHWNIRRQTARSFAKKYDFQAVVTPMWDEYFKDRYW